MLLAEHGPDPDDTVGGSVPPVAVKESLALRSMSATVPGDVVVSGDATGAAIEVTERRDTEGSLVTSDARYRMLAENTSDVVAYANVDLICDWVSPSITPVLGWTPEEVTGRWFGDLLHPDDLPAAQAVWSGEPVHHFEGRVRAKDGGWRWVRARTKTITDATGTITGHVTSLRDIGPEVEAMRVSRAARHELAEAQRLARMGSWTWDADTRSSTWSDEACLMHGYPPGTDVMQHLPELITDEAQAEAARRTEVCLSTGESFIAETDVHRPDGTVRRVESRGEAVRDDQGRIVGLRGTFVDITELHAARQALGAMNTELERRVAERTAELEAANEELRAFSYSVSHDLRAPVRAIAGFARLLELRNGDQLDEDGRHRLHNVVTAGEHLGRLIDDLLAYSRVGRAGVRAEPVPMEPLIDGIVTGCAELLDASGGRVALERPLAVPIADPALLDSVLLNLVTNAIKYRRPDVEPVVTISARREGDDVAIRVADNGIGIPADARESIFEPFRRLVSDEAFPGTGIGLAIVRRSVRAMGGEVTVRSAPGNGSTFTVVLPVA